MLSTLPRRLQKLRGRSAAELRERSAQALAAWQERMHPERAIELTRAEALPALLAEGVPTAPDGLIARWRAAPPFFPGLDDLAGTLAALRSRCPDHEPAVLRRADAVLAGRFDLLGYRGLDFGTPPRWHHDPLAGITAPDEHWSRIPFLDPTIVGDHKLVWELNRQQYLVTLGQAYAFTRDERYAEGVAVQLTAWMDANPPKRGVNWASSLEVAFRAMSWLWALRLVRDARAVTPALVARALAFLHAHAEHVARYLSTYFSPNTHLTGEALGLVFVGRLAPQLAGAERWRAVGERILLEQIPRQIRADGVYFEQATQYHRYTTEFYLQLALLLRTQDGAEPAPVRDAVGRLLDALVAFTGPDGRMPLLGDDDGGRLVQLDDRTPDDVRGVHAMGAVLLGRADLAWLGRHDPAPAIWLFGVGAGDALDALAAAGREPARAVALPTSGFYALRDGWAPTADHALLDAGPHGVLSGGHSHADALSLTLTVGGRPLFVDAGTYTYPGAERNAFRGPASHNVVTLDGCGAADPAGTAFRWGPSVDGRATAWGGGPGFDVVVARIDAFPALHAPATHARTVLRLDEGIWLVHDRIHAGGAHDLALRWQLAPGLRVAAAPGDDGAPMSRIVDDVGRPVAHVALSCADGTIAAEDAWVSRQYGVREPAPALTARARVRAGVHDLFTIVARGGTGWTPGGMRREPGGGHVLACRDRAGGGRLELLVPSDAGELRTADGTTLTGARLAIVRRSADGNVRQLTLLGTPAGGRLRLATGLGLDTTAGGAGAWAVHAETEDGRWSTQEGTLAVPAPPVRRDTGPVS